MKVAITGGAGYIGSHIALELLDEGHELLILDNLSTGSPENVYRDQKLYHFLEEDYSSQKGRKALKNFQPKVVFHLAALKAAGLSMEQPEEYCQQNIRKSLQLIEDLSYNSCRYFILSSTAAVYGNPRYLPIDEKHICDPVNYYGFTKKYIEQNLLWFSRLNKIRCALLRYFNAAGYDLAGRVSGLEKNPNNLIPIIMEVAIAKREKLTIFGGDYHTSDGTCIRDYIHVSDLSHAHFLAMQYLLKTDQDLKLNLGTERGYSVKEVLEVSEKICGKSIPHIYGERREGDSEELISSSQLAYTTIGWRAKHSSIEEIIKSTWDMYKKNYRAL